MSVKNKKDYSFTMNVIFLIIDYRYEIEITESWSLAHYANKNDQASFIIHNYIEPVLTK